MSHAAGEPFQYVKNECFILSLHCFASFHMPVRVISPYIGPSPKWNSKLRTNFNFYIILASCQEKVT